MSDKKSDQIAKVHGLYRCTGLGETVFCDPDEKLPVCSCKGGGRWELLKEKNMKSEDAIPIFIGRGIFHVIETDELPEIGHCYNIRQALGYGLKTGNHRVTAIDPDFKWIDNKSHIRISVERVGDMTDDLPIHQARQVTC